MPTVSDEEMEFGWRGWYDGDDTVHINHNLEGDERRSTLFHEYVHYLQVHRGTLTLPGPSAVVCEAEAQAFLFTDIYRRSMGLDLVGPRWWEPYSYCWKFYAPAGSIIMILKIPGGEEIIDLVIQ